MKLIPALPIEDDDRSIRYDVAEYRVTQIAIAKLRKAGLPKPQKYAGEDGEVLAPVLDLNLASVSNMQLGNLLVAFTACAEYASYCAAIAAVDRTVELNIFAFVQAKVRLSKTGTVRNRDDKTATDPRVVAANAKFLEKDAIAELTAVVQKNYERGLSTISREITRRQSELEYKQS